MLFSYQARDEEGEINKGEIEAADETSVVSSLRKKGLFVSKISKKSKPIPLSGLLGFKTNLKDKIIFTQQLGIMIKSGLSLVEALKALGGETQNKRFSNQISKIIADVRGGSSLSSAMKKHPASFDHVYVNSIQAGEKSGNLDKVLLRLATQLEKEYDLNAKLKGAMIYPAFILSALVLVGILVLVLIIPQLKGIFDEVGSELPLLTRLVMSFSDFLRKYIIYIIIATIVLVIAVKIWVAKTEKGRYIADLIKLHIPVFGNLNKKTYMARFTRTFAGLSAAGLPLLDVFKTSKEVVNNIIYQQDIDKMIKKIEVGESISGAIKDSPLFPAMVGQLTSVGEKSGNIEVVFDSMANFFDKEVENITANLSSLLEPILMLVMGVGVGILIVSVLQPIYSLVNTI